MPIFLTGYAARQAKRAFADETHRKQPIVMAVIALRIKVILIEGQEVLRKRRCHESRVEILPIQEILHGHVGLETAHEQRRFLNSEQGCYRSQLFGVLLCEALVHRDRNVQVQVLDDALQLGALVAGEIRCQEIVSRFVCYGGYSGDLRLELIVG